MKFQVADSDLINRIKNDWWFFVLLILGLLIIFVPLPQAQAAPIDRHLRIEASMYQFTPGVIKVNKGDKITLDLVAMDVVHGLSLDGYDFELTADPGQTKTAAFIAEKTGVFRFRCSVACGNLHPFMIGKLQVGPNLMFIRAMLLGILAMGAAFWSLRKPFSNLKEVNN
jgi:heme/copper-type cytochrome/quinol oxidase subunit 2